jgi:phenylalanyl-tRNA synthetase alpha chain
MSDIETIEADALTRAAAAEDLAALDALRVAFLGKTGSISTLLKSLGGMSPDDRRTLGPLVNGLRDRTAATPNSPPAPSTFPYRSHRAGPAASTPSCRRWTR